MFASYLIPVLIKSIATPFVNPITAAFVAAYTHRVGIPLMLLQQDAIFMIDPLPFSLI